MAGPSEVSRRTLLGRAAALGALAVPGAALLDACATGGGSGTGGGEKGTVSAANPLGVKEDAPLDVVIFKGGFGDQYAKDAEAAYKKKYPKATVKHTPTQQITQLLAPKFVGGNPPDVIDNSGAQNLDMNSLVSKGQLTDLTPLLDAASLDDPNKKVRDTLISGTVEQGQYGGKEVYALNYAYTVFGVWYSQTALDKYQITYPKTWAEMIAACEKLKKAGVAGWTYAGKYAYYVHFVMYAMIAKIGGIDVMNKIDNLEPNAWKDPAVKTAVEAFAELASKGYVLTGSEGLTHIESQTAWNQGKAIFIPNGSWVENESKPTTPANFKMGVGGPPSASAADKLPYGSTWTTAGEPFIVPKDGKNALGGMELLRIMLSKQQSQNFAKLVSSLTCVAGAVDGLSLPPGLTAANALLKLANDAKASSNPRLSDWYPDLEKKVLGQNTQLLMSKRLSAADWITRAQAGADAVAKNSAIKKFKHTS
ncbi:N-acetylglucosamine/diacetylchitobiose ABC transporter substrate-binding protein [Fodinicola acaciae]|uniref:N-acetylglucosamine/diacetylchitobiose ABC transporter substrate-binding protein n=1 Tax=Fodinicola acaciae TaxID=2681555 RepID=UPI0016522C93|nr:N-acetylglucosamine/diacetylchitobiose ABC transporter substrate-binding protein [Fodinicola acaciae]